MTAYGLMLGVEAMLYCAYQGSAGMLVRMGMHQVVSTSVGVTCAPFKVCAGRAQAC
jgi:hypothetical protein